MDCWAECLGDCSDEQSREHIVSESLFLNETIDVTGFPWCKTTKRIGIANLTAKILCRHHNSQLSPVDDGGAKAFAAFREMNRVSEMRRRLRSRFNSVGRHHIDGPLLERWLLKTLINISYKGDKGIGRGSTVLGKPTDELVRIAFGLEPFRGRAGLSFVVKPGMQMLTAETLTTAPLVKEAIQRIEGGIFIFRGFPMILFLEPEGLPTPLTGIQIGNYDLGNCQMNFHNHEITENQRGLRSQVLKISWPTRPS
jgi:hypothetical protein